MFTTLSFLAPLVGLRELLSQGMVIVAAAIAACCRFFVVVFALLSCFVFVAVSAAAAGCCSHVVAIGACVLAYVCFKSGTKTIGLLGEASVHAYVILVLQNL